jgi:nicotinate-nucleotide adenylyltransferase
MTRPGRLGVFGGTFDPVHFGHLDAAAAAHRALGLDQVLFLPSHLPPHRSTGPRTTMFHRFALVTLAIDGVPWCAASDLELARTGRSYTYDTLLSLHAEGWSPSQLFFIIGTDAFAEVALWRAFAQVIDGTNFAVVGRSGTTLEDALDRTPTLHARVKTARAGGAAALETGTAAGHGAGTGVYLIEAATRDVSSTAIRDRLAEGRSIADLVPEPVERHIIKHGLYGAVDRLHGDT